MDFCNSPSIHWINKLQLYYTLINFKIPNPISHHKPPPLTKHSPHILLIIIILMSTFPLTWNKTFKTHTPKTQYHYQCQPSSTHKSITSTPLPSTSTYIPNIIHPPPSARAKPTNTPAHSPLPPITNRTLYGNTNRITHTYLKYPKITKVYHYIRNKYALILKYGDISLNPGLTYQVLANMPNAFKQRYSQCYQPNSTTIQP